MCSSRFNHFTYFLALSTCENIFFWCCCSEILITNPKLLCLQAADILLYKATKVPVGEDQLQNVELTRKIASKFNSRFKCKLFPIPETVLVTEESSRRIKSLRHPEKKMSKSDSDQKSCLYLLDDPDTIRSKIKVAVTDVTSKVRGLSDLNWIGQVDLIMNCGF